jgi:hypothetical protein
VTGRLLVSTRSGEQRLALWADDRLAEYTVERDASAGRPGDIYLGRVTGIDKGLDAAFVDIGLARPGFLPLGERGERPTDGAAVVVQVTRGARGDKGAAERLAGRGQSPRLIRTVPACGCPAGRGRRNSVWPTCGASPGPRGIIRGAAAASGSKRCRRADPCGRPGRVWARAAAAAGRFHYDGDAVYRPLRDQPARRGGDRLRRARGGGGGAAVLAAAAGPGQGGPPAERDRAQRKIADGVGRSSRARPCLPVDGCCSSRARP